MGAVPNDKLQFHQQFSGFGFSIRTPAEFTKNLLQKFRKFRILYSRNYHPHERSYNMTNRAAGILLPITSLPSKYGIGCFSKSA